MREFKSGNFIVRVVSAVFAVAITLGIAEGISYAMMQDGVSAEHAAMVAKRQAETPRAHKG